ncbi:ATP phosphoribosyltransferase (ATP-PRTase) (ATP-PRT) [Cladochytrium tenue]|nr:ATP phosphoribosyltransferase (ATP-PRTase) (ATP-PRT) [Cladochytrium tenue]
MQTDDLADRLLFAVPKKGRLYEQVLKLLQGADFQFRRNPRLDIALCTNHPWLAFVFLPAKDIALFVANGNVDVGITGRDMVAEQGVLDTVDELLPLGIGRCRLCLQAPVADAARIRGAADVVGLRVATSFERLTTQFFRGLEQPQQQQQDGAEAPAATAVQPLRTHVTYVSGSVEAACALGLADAIVDLVESGDTMHAAKLREVHVLMTTEAVLLCNRARRAGRNAALVDRIFRRLDGVVTAQRYVLCTYNVTRVGLAAAVHITPGKKAPTISPLQHDGWVAVSCMVPRADVVDIMDRLEEIGAQDILITEIKNARMGHDAAYFTDSPHAPASPVAADAAPGL